MAVVDIAALSLPSGQRLLGLDLGEKTIGLALSDATLTVATPLETIRRTKFAADAVMQTRLPTLALLPRGRLDPVDACDYEIALYSPGVLRAVLDQVSPNFEYMLLDTPSGVGLVTRSALSVANFALIPFQSEPLSLRSLSRVLRVIERVRSSDNPGLQLLGVLPTMVDRRKDVSHSVMMEVWTGFEGVFDTAIPRADVFAAASMAGLPIGYLGGPASPEARRFEVLASEVEAVIDQLSPRSHQDVERPQRALL